MCYWDMDMFYRAVGHELRGRGLYCTGPLIMYYRAVYHVRLRIADVLLGRETWDVYHVLLCRGHILHSAHRP